MYVLIYNYVFVNYYRVLLDTDSIVADQSDLLLKVGMMLMAVMLVWWHILIQEYQSFTDLKFSKDKPITWIDWHPVQKGAY